MTAQFSVLESKHGHFAYKHGTFITKSLESIRTAWDGSLRDSNGDIVQFTYGVDGCDAAQLERVDMRFLIATTLSDSDSDSDSDTHPATFFTERERALYLSLRMETLNTQKSLLVPRVALIASLPFNPATVIEFYRPEHSAKDTMRAEEEETATDWLFDFLKELETHGHAATLSLRVALLWHMRFDHVRKILSLHSYREILETMRDLFRRALVQPGECVGPLAAAYVSEPATQLTLNTFHHCGQSSNSEVLCFRVLERFQLKQRRDFQFWSDFDEKN